MKRLQRVLYILAAAAGISAAAASYASASELYLLAGGVKAAHTTDDSYSWQVEYRQDILRHLAAGVSYLNEGHIKSHHRDGYTAQFWVRSQFFDDRVTLGAAIGPYFYMDTTSTPTPDGFSNTHGLKPMMSAAVSFHVTKRFLLEGRGNWVRSGSGFDSTSLLGGIGYHFDPVPDPQPSSPRWQEQRPQNEITFLAGQEILNSFDSQRSFAASVEYRRHLLKHMDWSVAGLYEGENRLLRRDGVISQLWATQQLLSTLSVGAGLGGYYNIHDNDKTASGTGANKALSWIATITGSYRFAPHWALRASWNRVITSYHRDTDVILGGLGYLF